MCRPLGGLAGNSSVCTEPLILKDPQRIAIFCPSLAGGGAERAMVNLASGLLASGKRVDFVFVRACSY